MIATDGTQFPPFFGAEQMEPHVIDLLQLAVRHNLLQLAIRHRAYR